MVGGSPTCISRKSSVCGCVVVQFDFAGVLESMRHCVVQRRVALWIFPHVVALLRLVNCHPNRRLWLLFWSADG